MNRRTILRLACFSAIIAGSLAISCGGGGGGSGGGVTEPPMLTATFTAGPPSPAPAMALSLEPGATIDAEFDVDVMITGEFNDFFGAGFRITVPPSVSLIGKSSAGSFILGGGSVATEFSAVQQGNEILIVATRIQGDLGAYVPGVDVGAGNSSKLMTLNFRANAETSGSFTVSAPRKIETCNDGTETCAAVADGTVGWVGGSLMAVLL